MVEVPVLHQWVAEDEEGENFFSGLNPFQFSFSYTYCQYHLSCTVKYILMNDKESKLTCHLFFHFGAILVEMFCNVLVCLHLRFQSTEFSGL